MVVILGPSYIPIYHNYGVGGPPKLCLLCQAALLTLVHEHWRLAAEGPVRGRPLSDPRLGDRTFRVRVLGFRFRVLVRVLGFRFRVSGFRA